jgi:hypothetical protein
MTRAAGGNLLALSRLRRIRRGAGGAPVRDRKRCQTPLVAVRMSPPQTCAQRAVRPTRSRSSSITQVPRISLWNEGPKILTNQPEARELQKADGLPAIKKSICR